MRKSNIIFVLLVSYMLCSLAAFAQNISGRSNTVSVDYTELSRDVVATTPSTQVQLGVPSVPKYHALIIGVSKYEFAGAQLPNLEQPVKDAEKLKDILTKYYAFPQENVHFLKNPTREDIINSFDKLIGSVGERDNLLIFYAGHGFYDKSTDFGFWLPANAKTNSRADWIANSTIKDYVSAVPAKHTLLITDACFGGSIFKTRSVTAMDTRKVFELYKEKSRKAITSGNLTEVPDQSFFLRFLLKTLEENNQDYLPASTLFSRMYEPVMNNSPTVPQFGVIQGAGDEGGDFIFIKKQ